MRIDVKSNNLTLTHDDTNGGQPFEIQVIDTDNDSNCITLNLCEESAVSLAENILSMVGKK